jgi:drug/metabolite transporter (DMT)-like permease
LQFVHPSHKRRILLLAAGVVICGTTGNTLLRVGMSSHAPIVSASPIDYLTAFVRIPIIIGVLTLIAQFIFQLTLLSWADLTFALPMTSPSYVVITLIGAFALGERVSTVHWFGVMLILCGVIVVGRTRPLTPGSGLNR